MDSKWDKVADKALDKLPVDKVYEDLLRPSLQNAGHALATVIDLANTVLLPFELLNEKRKLYLKQNLAIYAEKVHSSTLKPHSIPPAIGAPILEKLTLLDQEELSEAFVNLLSKASFEETIHSVHPAFVTTLSDLSTDEAKLLFQMRNSSIFPFIDLESYTNVRDTPGKLSYTTELATLLTGWEFSYKLEFPQNIKFYLYNLERLGIFNFNRKGEIEYLGPHYEEIEREYSTQIADHRLRMEIEASQTGHLNHLHVKRFFIEITDFGKDFITACMTNLST